jgi:hypothetical protein
MEFFGLQEEIFYAPRAQRMSEDWYNFTRFPCKSGFIDHHNGAGNLEPFHIDWKQQGTMWRYYRLNGGYWSIEWNFNDRFLETLGRKERNKYSAEEIWNKYLKRNTVTPIPR